MKKVWSWFNTHPFQVLFFMWSFVGLPVLAAFLEDWKPGIVVVFGVLVAGWAVSVWRHGRKVVVIAALLSFGFRVSGFELTALPMSGPHLTPALSPRGEGETSSAVGEFSHLTPAFSPRGEGVDAGAGEFSHLTPALSPRGEGVDAGADRVAAVDAVGIAVGVVVICGGGYCVYKVAKFCQRKFPPKGTNGPPSFAATGTDEYAAAYEYSAMGSCYVPPEEHLGPASPLTPALSPLRGEGDGEDTTFTLNVMVRADGVTTTMSADNTEGTAQTWEEFQSEMVSHGLHLTGRASYEPQWAFNGLPCEAGAVPLEFDPGGRVTHRNGELRRVRVERSVDLEIWHSLLEVDTGVGSRFKVVDTTREGRMFYRVTAL